MHCHRKMSVRLSVRLSAIRRYCVDTAKHIVRLFSPSASHAILVLPYKTLWQYSDGDPPPPDESVECKGYEIITNFDQYLALSRKRYKIWAYLQWTTTDRDLHTPYTRECHFEWVTYRNIEWHEASRGLPVTAEFLVCPACCVAAKALCFHLVPPLSVPLSRCLSRAISISFASQEYWTD